MDKQYYLQKKRLFFALGFGKILVFINAILVIAFLSIIILKEQISESKLLGIPLILGMITTFILVMNFILLISKVAIIQQFPYKIKNSRKDYIGFVDLIFINCILLGSVIFLIFGVKLFLAFLSGNSFFILAFYFSFLIDSKKIFSQNTSAQTGVITMLIYLFLVGFVIGFFSQVSKLLVTNKYFIFYLIFGINLTLIFIFRILIFRSLRKEFANKKEKMCENN